MHGRVLVMLLSPLVPFQPELSFPTRRSSDLPSPLLRVLHSHSEQGSRLCLLTRAPGWGHVLAPTRRPFLQGSLDRNSTRLNSSHITISYAVFCLIKIK